jgi:hypothetical protein
MSRIATLNALSKSSFKFEKTITSFESHEESKVAERAFWHSKTPLERLEATELMRQINYGYDPFTDRVQRVLTVIERPKS